MESRAPYKRFLGRRVSLGDGRDRCHHSARLTVSGGWPIASAANGVPRRGDEFHDFKGSRKRPLTARSPAEAQAVMLSHMSRCVQ